MKKKEINKAVERAIDAAGNDIYREICTYMDDLRKWRRYYKWPRLYTFLGKKVLPTQPIPIRAIMRVHMLPVVEGIQKDHEQEYTVCPECEGVFKSKEDV